MLGKLLRREGADPRVAEMFYRAVAQALLLLGSETWVVLAVMKINMEGTPTVFLRKITGKLVWWKADGIQVTPRAEVVW